MKHAVHIRIQNSKRSFRMFPNTEHIIQMLYNLLYKSEERLVALEILQNELTCSQLLYKQIISISGFVIGGVNRLSQYDCIHSRIVASHQFITSAILESVIPSRAVFQQQPSTI